MKNPNSKRKLRGVLKAAIWGALLFEGILCLDWLAAVMQEHGNDSLGYFIEVPSLFILAPAIILMMVTGIPAGGILNHITVALVGAFIFAIIASLWQFVLKGEPENKNQNTKI